MKIIKAEINWYEGYMNNPELRIVVDKIPKDLVYEQKGSIYYAEKEGFVDYFFYERPGNGFGGRHFELKMKDGSTKTLIGPWTSNPATVCEEGFPLTREVSIKEIDGKYDCYYSGSIIIELYKHLARVCGAVLNDELYLDKNCKENYKVFVNKEK